MTISVNNLYDLKSLLNKKLPKGKISINLPNCKDTYENKLNSCIKDCGCSTGTFFLLFAIVLSILLIPFVSFSFLGKILCGLSFCFFMAILGKLVGLYIARIKFYKMLKKFIYELETNKK